MLVVIIPIMFGRVQQELLAILMVSLVMDSKILDL